MKDGFKKDLLLRSAARLYSIGIDLEGAKEQIRKLASSGVDYSSGQMQAAIEAYMDLKAQWDDLEQEYLRLRDEILR